MRNTTITTRITSTLILPRCAVLCFPHHRSVIILLPHTLLPLVKRVILYNKFKMDKPFFPTYEYH